MPSILIAFATYREAEATLKSIEASVSSTPNLYTFSDGYILITGVGMLAAASQTAHHLPLAQEIWNFGLAGALQDDLPIGTICQVQSTSKFVLMPDDIDMHSQKIATGVFPILPLNSSGINLVSSDFPIHHLALHMRLAMHYQLVDMEGYGIAYAAKQAQKPCRIWKLVSDFATDGGNKLIVEHIDRLSVQCSELILKMLAKKTSSFKDPPVNQG